MEEVKEAKENVDDDIVEDEEKKVEKEDNVWIEKVHMCALWMKLVRAEDEEEDKEEEDEENGQMDRRRQVRLQEEKREEGWRGQGKESNTLSKPRGAKPL